MLILYQPAGRMEAYFKSVSEGAYKKLNDVEKQQVCQKHGFEVVGTALTYEKK